MNRAALKQFFTSRNTVILLFAVYFIIGMFIYRDYGVSTDEHSERLTSLANYTYVMERLMSASDSESVQQALRNAPDLMTWHDRYYGVALQTLTVFVEHFRNFEMSEREIYLMRHAFTFINYFVGGVFFYLILRRRFGDTFIPVVGALFFILYPRFFGESFYNIKDILFYSWCIIASYFTLRWLETEGKDRFIIPAAITLAIATNTRILGISILLLACVFAIIQGVSNKAIQHNIKKSCKLILLTFASFILITPFTWENPIKNTIDTFFHFLWFQPWDWEHFYMGEMITRDVPWHYIPVWMGITIPLIYIAMFFIGFAAAIILWVKKRKAHLYDTFFLSMFTCTLLGFILLRVSMYEGWRHAYSIFLPFLFVAVYGLHRCHKFFTQRRKAARHGFIGVVATSLIYLLVWIAINHPYQYVYFNIASRGFAERNFTLDYWYVSNSELFSYAIAHSDEPFVTIAGTRHAVRFLTEDERDNFALANKSTADFYVRGSRMDYEWRRRDVGPDFRVLRAITVDGMRIATLYERVLPFTVDLSLDVWDKVVSFESNIDDRLHLLHDGDFTTRWATERPQIPGDHMAFEFGETVDYNYIRLNQGGHSSDYPRDLVIYTSMDGINWQPSPIIASSAGRHFMFETEAYRFLTLVNIGYTEHDWWSVFDMRFGHAQLQEFE